MGYKYHLIDSKGESETVTAFSTQPVFMNGGENIVIDDQMNEYLKILLKSNKDNLYDEHYLSIYNNLDQGYFNIALIQCATLFEYYVFSTLKTKYKWSNNKQDKYKKCENCGGVIGISEVCRRGLRNELGIKLADTPEYHAFEENVIKKRNKIVHGQSLTSITKDECEKAIRSLVEVTGILQKMFDSTPFRA